MLFPLQRDCDDATMTLTMTVTIQARDQDVPSKIDLPVTEDIPDPSENKLAVQQSTNAHIGSAIDQSMLA